MNKHSFKQPDVPDFIQKIFLNQKNFQKILSGFDGEKILSGFDGSNGSDGHDDVLEDDSKNDAMLTKEIYRKIVGSLDVNQREAAGHMTGGDIAVTLKLNQAETNFRFGDRKRAAEETRDAILTIFRLPWLLPDQEGNLTTLPQSELFPAWHDKMWFADDDFRATVRKLVTDDVRFHNTTDMLDKVIERLMPPTPTIAAVKP